LFVTSCGASSGDDPILILAPSSLAPLQSSFDDALADQGHDAPTWIFAGSQTLITQLNSGAPADVIISADATTFEQTLAAIDGPAQTASITTNQLVVAVAPNNPGNVTSLDDFADPQRTIGICVPTAPCGRLAAEAAATLGVEISADTQESNARALTAKIELGELDAGLVYRTDALAADLSTVAAPQLEQFTNEYLAAAISADANFVIEFMTSDTAAAILTDAGFGP